MSLSTSHRVSLKAGLRVALAFAITPAAASAEDPSTGGATTVPTVACSAKVGERQTCPADTSAGVALVKSPDPGKCVLGKTWGFDDNGVWVSDGCSGEFTLGQNGLAGASAAAPPAPPDTPRKERIE